jgi:hypothetical protein
MKKVFKAVQCRKEGGMRKVSELIAAGPAEHDTGQH